MRISSETNLLFRNWLQPQKPFTSSHVNQLLGSLGVMGLVYRNRYGKYSFAVPLFGQFIQRQPVEGGWMDYLDIKEVR